MRSNTISPSRLFLTRDVEQTYGISASTLRAWRVRGGGPPYIKLSANRVAYEKTAIDEWLAARRFTSVADEKTQAGSRQSA